MSIDKFGEKWTEGFAKEAMALGLSKEGAKELLKFAALLDKKEDPKFIESFNSAFNAMTKAAGLGSAIYKNIKPGELFKSLRNTAGTAAISLAIPTLGLAGYYGLWRPYVGKGPYEREHMRIADAEELGLLTPQQANRARFELSRRFAQSVAAPTEARVVPNYQYGYWSPWYYPY